MLKEAIEYIVGLHQPNIYVDEVGDKWAKAADHYELLEREPEIPDPVTVNTLSGLLTLLFEEGIPKHTFDCGKMFIRVVDEGLVRVHTNYKHQESRIFLRYLPYRAEADTPHLTIGREMSQDQAIVELQSLYGDTPDRAYLLDLLSQISVEDGVTSIDNGVTQTVTARQGVALKETVQVKPIVRLQPYRTFLEVEQPVSDFLLRIGQNGRIALHEADGGAWRLEAKNRIAKYLRDAISAESLRGTDINGLIVMI